MNQPHLETYLNDHLAGSVAGLELLDRLIALHQGTPEEATFRQLRLDVKEDQEALQQLLARLGGNQSQVRKAAAWLSEKLAQAKLRWDDAGDGDLRLFESLETMALGIQGKMALWRALAAIADSLAPVRELDLGVLQRRAQEQFDLVETRRLRVARFALTAKAKA